MYSPQPAPYPAARPAGAARRRPRSRGTASLLAMLYLVIFAALALGFYAQTNVAATIAHNEVRFARALTAAESGMAFMRYTLTRVQTAHLPESQMLPELANELWRVMDGTNNLVDPRFGLQEVGMSDDGTAILIPRDQAAVIPLGNGLGFRVMITRAGRDFVVKVAGTDGSSAMSRGIEYVYGPRQLKIPFSEYGLAGRGQIEVGGGGIIRGNLDPMFGSVLSMSKVNPAIAMTGPGVISGKAYLKHASATYSYSASSSLAGGTDALHKQNNTIYLPPPPPEYAHLPEWPYFPTIDTDVFKPFATNLCLSPVGTYFKNIRIPANLGTAAAPFTFSAGTVIEGVCYIEAPNVVWFAGGCTIRGTIVGPTTPTGTLTSNVIEFRGQATGYDMSTLPQNADFPAELLALSGSSVLAPRFHVKFSGGYSSISGTIVSDQLTFSGGAGGSLTGYVIGMANQKLVVTGSGVLQLDRPAVSGWPAGVHFRSWYAPRNGSYREFHPRSEGM